MTASNRARTMEFDATERRTYERALVEARARAEQSEGRLRALQVISTSCAAAMTTDTVAATVVAVTTEALASQGCAMWLVDDDGMGLTRVAVSRVPDRVARRRVPVDGRLPAADAWQLGEVVALASPEAACAAYPSLSLSETGVAALVSLPLRARGQVVGVLEIYLPHGQSLGPDDLALYHTIVTHVAQTVEQARMLATLKRQALYDGLTGLPNRTHLRDRLAQATADEEGTAGTRPDVTVLAIDIDGFKAVNDRLGHAAGDRVLVDVARRLQASVRAGDTVARLGGDEFVVVCVDCDAVVAHDLAARMTAALRMAVPTGAEPMLVTASVGYAVLPGSHASGDLDELLDRADRAMYRAKEHRRAPGRQT